MKKVIDYINGLNIEGVYARKCWDGIHKDQYYIEVEVYDDLHDIDIEKLKRIIAEIETDIRIDLYIESEAEDVYADWNGWEV